MQSLVSSLEPCFIGCKQSDIGGLLFLLNGVTNAHLVVYPVPMICEAYFDCPVGTGPVSVPTGVNTTVHAGFYCILEFSCMFSTLLHWIYERDFPWISKGVGCSCSLSLSLQPLPSGTLSEFWLCGHPSSLLQLHRLNPRTWLGPPVLPLPLLQPGNLQPPSAEVGGLTVCGMSRVSRPARHLSKCRISLKQCQTSRDSSFLPAFLTGETDSLYVPIVLRLIQSSLKQICQPPIKKLFMVFHVPINYVCSYDWLKTYEGIFSLLSRVLSHGSGG